MEGRFFVTGHTLRRKPRKLITRMAIFTADLDVCPSQREITEVVIKGNLLPIERRMTGSAVDTEATAMLVILLMAGIAIRGRALECVILMAFIAGYTSVFPLQFESRQVVVEGRILPSFGCMAGITSCAKAQFVWIVGTVAGKTFLWCDLEISQAARIHMTQHTFHFLVHATQLEG